MEAAIPSARTVRDRRRSMETFQKAQADSPAMEDEEPKMSK
jgi:hypothetical protein